MSPPAKKATPRKTTAQQSGAARKAAAPGATKAATKVTKAAKAAKAAKVTKVTKAKKSTPPRSATSSAKKARSAAKSVRSRGGAPIADRLGSPRSGVLITGGGSGIGRATALALAEVGRPVAIWDINSEGAEETAKVCAAAGVATDWTAIDVADSVAVGKAVPEAARALGNIGGFVHGAGVAGPMSVDYIDDDLWDSVLNVNVRAAVMIARALIGPFADAGPGSAMVLISSIEGLVGSSMLTAYCASKSSVLGAMRSIGHRMASDGVRVNAVCPGAVATPMLLPALEIPGYRQSIEERTPLGRISMPEEIARPIRFLLSDEASFITGTHLVIDGGMTSITAI
jgi:NAD(P)-dependent dehydrogenase (short-subunit alcohol dehydrogenase family)